MQALFDALVVLHVICALTGFGSLALSGFYGFSAGSPDPTRRAEAARWFASPERAAWALLAVPVLGLVALSVEPGGRGPLQLWDLSALVLWAVATGVWLARLRPAAVRVRRGLPAPTSAPGDGATAATADGAPPAGDDPAWGAAGAVVGWAGVVTDIAFAGGLVLMVLQPH